MVKRGNELVAGGRIVLRGYNEQYRKYRMKKYTQRYKQDFFYSMLRSLPPDTLKDAKKVKARVIEHL
jgi:hypothetical protein